MKIYAVMESVSLDGPYGTEDLVGLYKEKGTARKRCIELEALQEVDKDLTVDGYFILDMELIEG